MPAAIIRSILNGDIGTEVIGNSRDDIRSGDLVTCNSVNTASSYQWTLLYTPEDKDGNPSAATLTSLNTQTTSFTVDKEGSYLLRLVLDGGVSTDILRYRVVTVFGDLKLIAAGERYDATGIVPSDISLQGWANDNNQNTQRLLYFVQRVSESGRVFSVDANRGTDNTNPQNDPTIAEGYADFYSVQDAIDAASLLSPSSTNPFVIRIRAGLYVEDLTIPPFVFLVGDNNATQALGSTGILQGRSIVIRATSGHLVNAPLANDAAVILGLTLENAGLGSTLTKQGSGTLLLQNSAVLQGNAAATGAAVEVLGGTFSSRVSFIHSYATTATNAAVIAEGGTSFFCHDSTIKGPSGIIANSAKVASCTVSVSQSFVISTALDPSAFGIQSWSPFLEVFYSKVIQSQAGTPAITINPDSTGITGNCDLYLQHSIMQGSVLFDTVGFTGTTALFLGSLDFLAGSLSVLPSVASLTSGAISALTVGESIAYNPTTLSSTNVQDAIDELAAAIVGPAISLVKLPVRAVSETDLALSGLPLAADTDNVALSASDRVLLTAQATASENGIWEVSAGAWSRPSDFAVGSQVSGALVYIAEGDLYERELWACEAIAPNDVVDTNSLPFVRYNIGANEELGTGLTRTGKGIDVVVDTVTTSVSTSISSAVPVPDDMTLAVALSTSGDDADTSLTLTRTPAGGSGNKIVYVLINGMAAKVGNAIKTDDCYFSADGGTTARSYDNLSAGDTLFWNGIIAGFDLEPSDLISFQYAAL